MEKQEVLKQAENFYSFILNRIAETIKEKRLATMVDNKPMTLNMLAKDTGVSTTVISDLENKIYLPKVDVIIRLMVALGISVDDILNDKSKRGNTDYARTPDTSKKSAYDTIKRMLLILTLSNSDINEILNYIEYKENSKKPKTFFYE